MAKEGQSVNYTGEEAIAYQAFRLEQDEWFEGYRAVRDRIEQPDIWQMIDDPDDFKELLSRLESRHNTVVYEYPHVLHARLCRVMPHLADIFTFLFWPEFFPTPEWVDDCGRPPLWGMPQPATPNHMRADR